MTGALLTFAAASIVIVLIPGPDTLIVLRGLVLRGRRRAVLTAAGVITGLLLWVAAAALGLSAVLRASHAGYTVLRVVGAAYLITLGVQALRARAVASAEDGSAGRGGVLGTGYRAGLLCNLLNPKIGVFFVTFLPGFVPSGEPVAATSLLLGGIFIAEAAVYFVVLLTLADRVRAALRRPRLRRTLDRATGVVLVGFGIRLISES